MQWKGLHMLCHALQADQTLKRFTDKAFTDAMHAVMSGWTEHDVKNLGNNTLMLNYHTHAWNKTIQGEPTVCVQSKGSHLVKL